MKYLSALVMLFLVLGGSCLSSAEDGSGQHYHFDDDEVLSECELPFTIGYEAAPWEEGQTGVAAEQEQG